MIISDPTLRGNPRIGTPCTGESPTLIYSQATLLKTSSSVIVHRSDTLIGKSYVFLRPKKNHGWIKFRNQHVVFATKEQAMDENFGFDNKADRPRVSTTAQALIYLREDMLDELLYP